MKYDTHRHLGGSIPIDWIWRVIRDLGLKHLAEDRSDVVTAMTFAPNEHRDFYRFLSKFTILDHMPWTEGLIASSIKSVCDELEQEKIDYCWLDFSINKYMDALKWHKHEAIKFVHECFETYRPGGVGLVLSLKYESTKASQRQYADLINNPDIADRLIGLDLVGDEEQFDYKFYQPIFKEWKNAGKMLRAHVAESQSAENGLHAIQHLGVTNIAHGIKMIESEMMEIALDHDITFDLGLTSNYLTGVWTNPDYHPIIALIDTGQKVTLGTDDPIQCSITLDDEFILARYLGVGDDDITIMKKIANDNCDKYR